MAKDKLTGLKIKSRKIIYVLMGFLIILIAAWFFLTEVIEGQRDEITVLSAKAKNELGGDKLLFVHSIDFNEEITTFKAQGVTVRRLTSKDFPLPVSKVYRNQVLSFTVIDGMVIHCKVIGSREKCYRLIHPLHVKRENLEADLTKKEDKGNQSVALDKECDIRHQAVQYPDSAKVEGSASNPGPQDKRRGEKFVDAPCRALHNNKDEEALEKEIPPLSPQVQRELGGEKLLFAIAITSERSVTTFRARDVGVQELKPEDFPLLASELHQPKVFTTIFFEASPEHAVECHIINGSEECSEGEHTPITVRGIPLISSGGLNGLKIPESFTANLRINGVGDFDGDGHVDDLVLRNLISGNIEIWQMGVDGTTATPTRHIISPSVPLDWQIKGVGDFDGDGRVDDLVWRNNTDGRNEIWLMRNYERTIALIDRVNPKTHPDWHIQGVGDFDGDGRVDDLVWRNNTTGRIDIWLLEYTVSENNRINKNKIEIDTAGDDLNWQIKGVGDFDGDGHVDDLVWRNDANGENHIWLMTGTSKQIILIDQLAPGWDIKGIGNFDNEGVDDLVWENTDTSEYRIWAMVFNRDGNTITLSRDSVYPGPKAEVVGRSWHIKGIVYFDNPVLVWRQE